MPAIQLSNLSKSYEQQAPIFEKLNLSIQKNEFFVLVGPSGCGKSTLLRLIAGLETASEGKIQIFDRDVSQLPPQQRQLSMVFQSYALFPHMNVRENILFGLDDKKISKSEQEKRLEQAVELTNLEPYLNRRPKKLSGGQRQRVALARAIASKQPLMLMDEPLSNLDAKLRESMRTQIKQLQRELNMNIIYVTHDQTEAMTMGDRIALLNEGVIQQIGAPLELYNKPKNLFVASFIGTPKINAFELINSFGRLSNAEQSINFPLPWALKERHLLTVAVRPEDLFLSQNPEEANLKGEILNVEQLGSESLVTFLVVGQKYRAKLQGQLLLELGQPIFFKADPKKLHYFDVESGLRLEDGGLN